MTTTELYQTKVWTSRQGVTVKVKDMAPSHRRNLLTWIERNAATLLRAETSQAWSFSFTLNGEMAQDAIDREINRLEEMTPAEYVDQLPFVQKLRKRVAKDLHLTLEERQRLDEVGRRHYEEARVARAAASLDEPDPEPPRPAVRPLVAAEKLIRDQHRADLDQQAAEREHAAEVEERESGFAMNGGSNPDGWPDTRFAVNGDGYG